MEIADILDHLYSNKITVEELTSALSETAAVDMNGHDTGIAFDGVSGGELLRAGSLVLEKLDATPPNLKTQTMTAQLAFFMFMGMAVLSKRLREVGPECLGFSLPEDTTAQTS